MPGGLPQSSHPFLLFPTQRYGRMPKQDFLLLEHRCGQTHGDTGSEPSRDPATHPGTHCSRVQGVRGLGRLLKGLALGTGTDGICSCGSSPGPGRCWGRGGTAGEATAPVVAQSWSMQPGLLLPFLVFSQDFLQEGFFFFPR